MTRATRRRQPEPPAEEPPCARDRDVMEYLDVAWTTLMAVKVLEQIEAVQVVEVVQ